MVYVGIIEKIHLQGLGRISTKVRLDIQLTLIVSPTAQLESAVLLTPWPSLVVDRAVSLVFHGRHENDHTGRSDDRVAQFIYSVHHRFHFRHGIVSGDVGDPNLHKRATSFIIVSFL